jgi:hypothetical protein
MALYLKPTRLPGNPADDYEVFDANRPIWFPNVRFPPKADIGRIVG